MLIFVQSTTIDYFAMSIAMEYGLYLPHQKYNFRTRQAALISIMYTTIENVTKTLTNPYS